MKLSDPSHILETSSQNAERTMPTTINLSHDELRARRQQILAGIGMTEEVLRERAMTYMLQPHERKAFEAVRAIDFLLGDK
ncbi:MAG TPA: hypothetical protein VFC19_02410 [Candidatus Limnocylindrales bacterium]|nr:hypothetical protein [Candidatus Limnocylindrales bacterium]